MPSQHRVALSLWLSLSLCGCLFPVIDFDDHSTPHNVAVRARASGYSHLAEVGSRGARGAGPATAAVINPQSLTTNARSTGLTALPPRQRAKTTKSIAVAQRQARPSVLAPDVPAPELPTPQNVASCHQLLRAQGTRFRVIAPALAKGVRWPIRLTGTVGGVAFEPGDPDDTFAVLDCRLALALHEWAGELRRAGVRRVEYYSMYRPGARVAGGKRISGHAHGMAIDAARFTLKNGTVLNVLEDWEGRDRGEAPCPARTDESSGARLLRAVTCSAADRNLFQVVLTPHYNSAHDNHVHLEIKPEVDWTYVR